MADDYYRNSDNTQSAARAATHAVSDATVYATPSRAFIPNLTGTLAVVTQGGDTVAFPVVGGVLYPISIVQAKDTGTTTVTSVTIFW